MKYLNKSLLLMFLLFSLCLSSCNFSDNIVGKNLSEFNEELNEITKSLNNNSNSIENNKTKEISNNNEINNSNVKKENEKPIYEFIKEALINAEVEINLSGYKESNSSEEIFNLVEKIVNENPLILYYRGCEYWSNGILKLQYSKDKKVIFNHRKEINKKVDYIISNVITNNMSDFEKEKVIHDYIINNSKYDEDYILSIKVSNESYSPYGVLIKGKGVCEGYAKAMKLIMDKINIECIIVVGKANKTDHAWNMIKLDNNYYHVDLTWDDPVTNDSSDILSYDYFNINDKDMRKDHIWDKNNYPICNSTKYNYYYYNGMIIKNYDEFYKKLQYALLNNINTIEIKILNYNKNIYDIPKTIEKIAMNNLLNFNKFSYSINDKTGVINIYFE